jgi:protein-tyrosine phosphatase
MGLDISRHCSQPVTERLAQFADIILTMTDNHRAMLIGQWPHVAGRTHLIRHDGMDVADPIGMSEEVYRKCAEQLDSNLTQWANKLELSIVNDVHKA